MVGVVVICLFAYTPINTTDRRCKIQLLTLCCHTTDPPMTKVSVGLQRGHNSTALSGHLDR